MNKQTAESSALISATFQLKVNMAADGSVRLTLIETGRNPPTAAPIKVPNAPSASIRAEDGHISVVVEASDSSSFTIAVTAAGRNPPT